MKTIYKKLLLLLLLLPFTALSQSTLKGIVVDSKTKQPLPGVNVVKQGSTAGVSTDFDGSFTLKGLKSGDVLNFTFVGYRKATRKYAGESTMTVPMQEESNQLQEVVVQTGYGSVKKKDATGSVQVLTSKDFNKGQVVSVDQMLSGRVAGLQITNNGGSPGDGATIRIRQGASLNANNDPLYVIDGIPVETGGLQGAKNPLSMINQNDIESVTVLKDASSTAIYGSRASNGVVIITTKKGSTGDLKVNYNGNFSVSQLIKKVDVLSADQFRTYVNTYGTIDNNPTSTTYGKNIHALLLGNANTDWQNEIYQTALGHDHNISFSGGIKNISMRASYGVSSMEGILKNDKFNRNTIAANLVGKFFDDHLKLELNNKTALIDNNYSNQDAIGAAASFDPTQSIYNPNGTLFNWSASLAGANPLSQLNQKTNLGNSSRSIGNVQAEYKLHFFPDLKLIANFGYDYMQGKTYGNTAFDFPKVSEAGDSYLHTESKRNRLMDLYLNYKKSIKAINGSVEVTGGYNYQNFLREYDDQSTKGASGVTTIAITTPELVNLQSFFGRAILNISDKYILTGTIRRDGTSRFAPDFKWANFPSAALAWKISDESFVKDSKVISNLKLRLGWGITGQQNVTVYPSIPLYLNSDTGAQYQLGNTYYVTTRPQQYNPLLKWEQTETRNVGLDFGFFKNRFNGTVDVYEKLTSDLLAKIPNPAFYGFSNYDNYNVGSMKNQGIEVSAEIIPIKTDAITWSIGGNVTLQNSKITDLLPGAPNVGLSAGDAINGGVDNHVQQNQVGYAPGSFYVYEQAYNAAGQPINGVYIDRNGNGTIDEGDRYFFHKPAADVFYGMFTNLSYKNFDFSMSWRGSWNNYVYNNIDSSMGWSGQVLVRNTDLANGVNNLLETNFTTATAERYQSDYYIQKASFIKLDNVTLGYNFKKVLDSKVNARLTFGGQNLLTITPYKGLDPEIGNGLDKRLYPRPRMFTLGLNLNF